MDKFNNLDLIGKIAQKGKRIDSTDNNTNTEINTSNTTSTEIDTISTTNNSTNTSTNISTNTSTNTSTDTMKETSNRQVYKKKKERIEKVQRAYYFNSDVVNKLEKFCKKNKVDKSEIVNEALTEFLNKYQ